MRLFNIKFYVPLDGGNAHAEAMDLLARLDGDGLPAAPSPEQFADEVQQFLLDYPHVLMVDREVWHSVDQTSTDVYQLIISFPDMSLSDYCIEGLAEVPHDVEYRDSIRELFRTCTDIDIKIERLH